MTANLQRRRILLGAATALAAAGLAVIRPEAVDRSLMSLKAALGDELDASERARFFDLVVRPRLDGEYQFGGKDFESPGFFHFRQP